MTDMEKFMDKNNLIGQGAPTFDFGDSCFFTNHYYFGIWVWHQLDLPVGMWPRSSINDLQAALLRFRVPGKPGKFRRHDDPEKWYSDADRMSRDQSTPLVINMGAWGLDLYLDEFLVSHMERWFLFTHNTIGNFQYRTLEEHLDRSTPDVEWDYNWKAADLTFFEFWASEIRAAGAWYLYPLLLVFDLETFYSSVFYRFDDDDDVLNHITTCSYSKFKFPTHLTYLSNKINDYDDMTQKLTSYLQQPNPYPMFELFEPVIKDAFGEKSFSKWQTVVVAIAVGTVYFTAAWWVGSLVKGLF